MKRSLKKIAVFFLGGGYRNKNHSIALLTFDQKNDDCDIFKSNSAGRVTPAPVPFVECWHWHRRRFGHQPLSSPPSSGRFSCSRHSYSASIFLYFNQDIWKHLKGLRSSVVQKIHYFAEKCCRCLSKRLTQTTVGGGCTQFVHGRSRMTIDPRIPTMPGRSTSGFHQPGRHCLHRARSHRVRCSASRVKGGLHPSKNRS